MTAIIVFAKSPQAGRVKTRLGSEIGLELAAELYRAFLEQTLELCRKCCSSNQVYVTYAPPERGAEFRSLAPDDFQLFPQSGTTLGERLINAFRQVFTDGASQAIAIGSDSPTLPAEYITQAIQELENHDLILGPAQDGGYYLIGLTKLHRELFTGIGWSTGSVLRSTCERAEQLGISFRLLPQWYDIDDLPSLKRALADDQSGRIASMLPDDLLTLCQ